MENIIDTLRDSDIQAALKIEMSDTLKRRVAQVLVDRVLAGTPTNRTVLLDVSYQVITEESREIGDVAESGFEREDREIELDNIESLISDWGCLEQDSTGPVDSCTWWQTVDADTDIMTGDDTLYGLHIHGDDEIAVLAANMLLKHYVEG